MGQIIGRRFACEKRVVQHAFSVFISFLSLNNQEVIFLFSCETEQKLCWNLLRRSLSKGLFTPLRVMEKYTMNINSPEPCLTNSSEMSANRARVDYTRALVTPVQDTNAIFLPHKKLVFACVRCMRETILFPNLYGFLGI